MGFLSPIAHKKDTWSTPLGCSLSTMGENVAHNSGESHDFVDSRKHARVSSSFGDREATTGNTSVVRGLPTQISCYYVA